MLPPVKMQTVREANKTNDRQELRDGDRGICNMVPYGRSVQRQRRDSMQDAAGHIGLKDRDNLGPQKL